MVEDKQWHSKGLPLTTAHFIISAKINVWQFPWNVEKDGMKLVRDVKTDQLDISVPLGTEIQQLISV